MASLAGGLVGAALGSVVPGVGTSLGWAVGSALGSALFPTKTTLPTVTGPRLSDLNVMSSAYGQTIPIIYGTARTGTNLIWAKPIREVRTETTQGGGGKGAPSQPSQTTVQYTYFGTFAVAVCEGPVQGVGRIWANNKVIWDAGISDASISGGTVEVYTGTETQGVSPTIEAVEGVGNTPSYRGICYVVFNDIPLADFGNRIPNISAEVARRINTPSAFAGFGAGIKNNFCVSAVSKMAYDSTNNEFSILSRDNDAFGTTEYRTADFQKVGSKMNQLFTTAQTGGGLVAVEPLSYKPFESGSIIAYPASAKTTTPGAPTVAQNPAIIYSLDGGATWQSSVNDLVGAGATCRTVSVVNGKLYMAVMSGSAAIGLFENAGAGWTQLDSTTKYIHHVDTEFHLASGSTFKITTDMTTITGNGSYNVNPISVTKIGAYYYALKTDGTIWRGVTTTTLSNTYATGITGSFTGTIPQLKIVGGVMLAIIRYNINPNWKYIDLTSGVMSSQYEGIGNSVQDIACKAGRIYVKTSSSIASYDYVAGSLVNQVVEVTSPSSSNTINNVTTDGVWYYMTGNNSFGITDTSPVAGQSSLGNIFGDTNWRASSNSFVPHGCFKSANGDLHLMGTLYSKWLEMISTNSGVSWSEAAFSQFSTSTETEKTKSSVMANGKLYVLLGGNLNSVMVMKDVAGVYTRQLIDPISNPLKIAGKKIKAAPDGSFVYFMDSGAIIKIDTATEARTRHSSIPAGMKLKDAVYTGSTWYASFHVNALANQAGAVVVMESPDLATWTDITPPEILSINSLASVEMDIDPDGSIFALCVLETNSGDAHPLYLTNDFSSMALTSIVSGVDDLAHVLGGTWVLYSKGSRQQNTFIFTASNSAADFSTPVPISEIVTDISEKTGIDPATELSVAIDQTLKGYIINGRSDGRSAIEPLLMGFSLEVAEGEAMKFTERGSSGVVATIPSSDLIELAGGDLVSSERSQELAVPKQVTVDYIDRPADYQVNSLHTTRIDTESDLEMKISLPVVLNADEARQISEKVLYTSWVERNKRRFSLSRKYSYLEPGDPIIINTDSADFLVRIISIKQGADGSIDVEALDQDSTTYFSKAKGAGTSSVNADVITSIEPTTFEFIDVAALSDTADTDSFGFYFAARGETPAWRGCAIYESQDGGVSYSVLRTIDTTSSIGTLLSAVGAPPNGTDLFDNLNTIDIQIPDSDLSSESEINVLNGGNAILVGDEIIQYETAVLTAPNTYTLSVLLRGRKDTFSSLTHSPGERVVVLPPNLTRITTSQAAVGVQKFYKIVTFGQSLNEVSPVTFTYTGANLKPLSVKHGRISKDSTQGFVFYWMRSERVNHQWIDGVDVPVQDSIVYEIDIYSGSVVVATYTVTTEHFVYSFTDQINDFGSTQTNLTAKIYRVSSLVGRGAPATLTI